MGGEQEAGGSPRCPSPGLLTGLCPLPCSSFGRSRNREFRDQVKWRLREGGLGMLGVDMREGGEWRGADRHSLVVTMVSERGTFNLM